MHLKKLSDELLPSSTHAGWAAEYKNVSKEFTMGKKILHFLVIWIPVAAFCCMFLVLMYGPRIEILSQSHFETTATVTRVDPVRNSRTMDTGSNYTTHTYVSFIHDYNEVIENVPIDTGGHSMGDQLQIIYLADNPRDVYTKSVGVVALVPIGFLVLLTYGIFQSVFSKKPGATVILDEEVTIAAPEIVDIIDVDGELLYDNVELSPDVQEIVNDKGYTILRR
jgi:hypothetical protein